MHRIIVTVVAMWPRFSNSWTLTTEHRNCLMQCRIAIELFQLRPLLHISYEVTKRHKGHQQQQNLLDYQEHSWDWRAHTTLSERNETFKKNIVQFYSRSPRFFFPPVFFLSFETISRRSSFTILSVRRPKFKKKSLSSYC